MSQDDRTSPQYRWALLRFSIISGLLASPPARGELQTRIDELATRSYQHPVNKELLRFGFSSIERWYYLARDADNPMDALRRDVRKDAGTQRLHPELIRALEKQFRAHRRWTYKLHADNIAALVEEKEDWGPAPSYPTIRRAMKGRGWIPRRSRRSKKHADEHEQREVRSFESSHVHALWHLDFHEGGRRVVGDDGNWFTPWLFGAIDDRSRLICHAQWYRIESAETLAHGLHQAFLRRGLPRAIMTDRGGAELAGETLNGLDDLGVDHRPTLAESPHQNGKQERFWGTLEGRLMKMLEGLEITLEFLNHSTLAWIEQEYHQAIHDEISTTPLERMLAGPSVARRAPDAASLRHHFSLRETRTQRRGDGTVSIKGIRFELPARLRHLSTVHVRFRRWDYSMAWVIDPASDTILAQIKPVDKELNASGLRRVIEIQPGDEPQPIDGDGELPPLMRKILRDFAATGLPAPYIPLHPQQEDDDDE